MSLYVRVKTAFFSSRKTLRLRAMIGDAAFWVPIRIWSYAAEAQPNGDFSEYQPEEIALSICYQGDARAMLEALQQAQFFDGMKIHDWEEHNAYHATFKERAKKAAAARWDRQKEKAAKRKDSTRKERKGKEPSIASSNAQASSSNASSITAFIDELRPLYPGIDIEQEFRKMQAFFLTPRGKGRNLTKRFAVGWLNRTDAPMNGSNGHKESKAGQWLDCNDEYESGAWDTFGMTQQEWLERKEKGEFVYEKGEWKRAHN